MSVKPFKKKLKIIAWHQKNWGWKGAKENRKLVGLKHYK